VDGHEPQGTLVRRKDDEPEAIRTRMQVYRDQTAPVVDWYAAQGARMVSIDALGTLEEVETRVLRGLGLA
jgi:adenylate kinase